MSAASPYVPGAPRASLLVPRAVAVFVGGLSLTLLVIGADSPYTHANLAPGYDRGYTRTEQIVVGTPVPYGVSADAPPSADVAARGARLFVADGCATCHGVDGRGGVVGPAIAHNDAGTIRQRTQVGPRGMPRFSDALTDDEISAISAYLRSMGEGR